MNYDLHLLDRFRARRPVRAKTAPPETADYPVLLRAQMRNDSGLAAATQVSRLAEAIYYARLEAFKPRLQSRPWAELHVDVRRRYHDLALLLIPVLHPDATAPPITALEDASHYSNYFVLRCVGAKLDEVEASS